MKRTIQGECYTLILAISMLMYLQSTTHEEFCNCFLDFYQHRMLSVEFHESEYIAMILGVVLLMSFMGVPVLIIAREDQQAYLFVLSAFIFTVCMAILCLIYVPKVVYHYQNPRGKSKLQISGLSEAGAPKLSTNNVQSINETLSDADVKDEEEDESEGMVVVSHPADMVAIKQELSMARLARSKEIEGLVGDIEAKQATIEKMRYQFKQRNTILIRSMRASGFDVDSSLLSITDVDVSVSEMEQQNWSSNNEETKLVTPLVQNSSDSKSLALVAGGAQHQSEGSREVCQC